MELTKDEYITGFKLSLENAKSFIENAKLLFKKGSYGHSVGISMLAIDECGKALFLFALYDGIIDLDTTIWKIIFRNHVTKIYIALYDYALFKNFPKDEVEYIKSLAPKLDSLKQRGFYVVYLKKYKKWVTPQDDDLKEIAKTNLNYAKKIYNSVSIYQKKFYFDNARDT